MSPQTTTHTLILWDWKEQPPWDDVATAQALGHVYLTAVPNTGGDEYAIVAAQGPLTSDEAQQAWDAFLSGLDES